VFSEYILSQKHIKRYQFNFFFKQKKTFYKALQSHKNHNTKQSIKVPAHTLKKKKRTKKEMSK
jgi:hypothetical protein